MSRAQHHFKELQREVDNIFESGDVCKPIPGHKPNGMPCLRVKNVPTPDPRVGVIVGDVAHALRSALDHLVYQLCIPKRATEPTNPTAPAFPITSSPQAWKDSNWRLDQAPRGTKTVVERLQPYHRRKEPDAWLLWQLREISDIDKHRLLHVAPAAIDAHQMAWRSDGPGAVTWRGYHVRKAPLKENAIAVWWDIDAGPEANVQVDANLIFGIAFDKFTPSKALRNERILSLLWRCGTFINDRVIPEVAPLLR
jgi:hypothetical protein